MVMFITIIDITILIGFAGVRESEDLDEVMEMIMNIIVIRISVGSRELVAYSTTGYHPILK